MNKPAAKEPSMDEILSSIRQIIADEDQDAGKPTTAQAVAAEPVVADDDGADEPLALSPQQMIDPSEPVEEFDAEVTEVEAPAAEDDVEEAVSFDIPDATDDEDVAGLASMLADAEREDDQEEECVDSYPWIENQIGTHDAADRTRCAHSRYNRIRPESIMCQTGQNATQQIKAQKLPMSQLVFDVVTEDP